VTWKEFTARARSWKKIGLWAAALIIALGASAVIITALLVKQSPSFRQGLLAKAENDIHETTGASVAVRDFRLDFFPLHLDLYGLVVRGNEPPFGEPLLHAENVDATIELRSLWARRWSFGKVVIDRPVVHLLVNQVGETNLPQPTKNRKRKTSIFDVAVRQLQLHGAELDGNQRKIVFDAELHNLHSSADFDPGLKRYHGVLKYAAGTFKYEHYTPLAHSLDLSFDATAAKLTVNRLNVTAAQSQVGLTGSVEDYSRPIAQVAYDAHLATSDVAQVLQNVSLPAGVVHLVGSASYRHDAGHTALETVSLSGTVSSSSLVVTTPLLRSEINDFGAKYKLSAGNADVDNIHAQVFAGKMSGSLSLHDLAGVASAKLQARLNDASLEQLQAAEPQGSTPESQLRGRISADVEATWNKKLEDLAARGNVTLAGTLGRDPAAPLHAAIHAEYAAASQQLVLHQSYVRTAQTSITLEGSVSEHSQLQLSLRSGNLHEVELLARDFRLAPSGQPGQNFDLRGTGSFTGSVSGPASAPHLKGQLEASDLRVKETRWRLLHTDVDASPTSLSFTNGSLEAGTPTSEKSQRPEPAPKAAARSEGQMPRRGKSRRSNSATIHSLLKRR
jgi:translocation and assembly module TamB